MVYRIYVEKKKGLTAEASSLKNDLKSLLLMDSLEDLRVINRYDVENIDKELFDYCVKTVFSEPQLDIASEYPDTGKAYIFAVEYLPGQFDQRADSAAQCIKIISPDSLPVVRTAKVYAVYGNLSEDELAQIKKYVINPVESREAAIGIPETLSVLYTVPESVKTLDGFISLDSAKELSDFIAEYSLAMDEDDLAFCRDYFRSEKRDPTITEIRMIDTYWSDHCRHTTFLTTIDSVSFADKDIEAAYNEYIASQEKLGRKKPVNLMDIATGAVRYLKAEGKLPKLDESEEINACTVKIKVEINGEDQDWLLLFKNETHNHPTEIEPFGGAATCIGGAIRDPLSGRSYVYSAMRVTGAGDPLAPVSETLEGKLPQRKIVTTAANGYSSYGNQIGLATGLVDEIYHSGYEAKRMEIGAVIGAVPAENVRREVPSPGDHIILLGGRTGRDGCGGATGSSKSHTLESLEECGAEVQKGNAPEERKLQRLFRNKDASLLIKRCNDFGAGGVSVAIGELADGIKIDLNAVPKKYEGLDGTELAISESQERMAVVVAPEDSDKFIRLAGLENLEATVVAVVTDDERLVMNWNGSEIVNISREFLNSNGAEKHINIEAEPASPYEKNVNGSFKDEYLSLAGDLNVCSKRGLSERFDSTIGAGTVLMPFGGKYQLTPIQAMVNKISSEKHETLDCSVMAYGYNPFISEKSPYHGAYLAVIESVSKLIAAGASFDDVYLTLQEYFEKPRKEPKRWGKPLSALLGAFKAQLDYGIAAIGGKDSMSGSFESLNVPPTLVSFAVTTAKATDIISNEFKDAGHTVVWIRPEYDSSGLPEKNSLKAVYSKVTDLIRSGKALSVYTPSYGGAAEAVMKMAFGNMTGFRFSPELNMNELFGYFYGSFIAELSSPSDAPGIILGETVSDKYISYRDENISLNDILSVYESKLEPIFACNIKQRERDIPALSFPSATAIKTPHLIAEKPHVLIPVFPGTNCEYDSAKAFERAGAEAEIFVINNITSAGITESIEAFADKLSRSQMVFIPGGFSGGDEPDGSGKFITAFFRNGLIKEQVNELIKNRGGLMCGICNGFQALIKLGLVPYGEIIDTDENCPTLTYNTIGRHQSRLVRTRIASVKSPWLSRTKVGEIYTVPVSHGEGRFIASPELILSLAENGQIATQYTDTDGRPDFNVAVNPNDSEYAIEGITSLDGRIFGKMGHSERIGIDLYKNVAGNFDMKMFESAVDYFKI